MLEEYEKTYSKKEVFLIPFELAEDFLNWFLDITQPREIPRRDRDTTIFTSISCLGNYFEDRGYKEVHLRETCEEDLKNMICLPGLFLSITRSNEYSKLGLDDDYPLIDRVILMHPVTPEDYRLKQIYNAEIDELTQQIIYFLTKSLDDLLAASVIDIKTYNFYKNKSWMSDEIVDYFKFKAIERCQNHITFYEKYFKYRKKIKETELLEHTKNIMDEWLKQTGKGFEEMIKISAIKDDYADHY
jgi:hypothetical protein